MSTVGIVIVSHSPKVAEGAADMVRQMVGGDFPLAWTGGDPAGKLGTSFEAITEAIHRAWSEAGVAILVDLGGAETNSEAASSSAMRRSSRGRLSRRPRPPAAPTWRPSVALPKNCRHERGPPIYREETIAF
jgi:hypothetical protein